MHHGFTAPEEQKQRTENRFRSQIRIRKADTDTDYGARIQNPFGLGTEFYFLILFHPDAFAVEHGNVLENFVYTLFF